MGCTEDREGADMTERLVWDNALCIGHSAIDADHKKVIEIANAVISIRNPSKELDALKAAIHD
jgi:hemerythrin